MSNTQTKPAVNYRDLTVYKKARDLVVGIDRLIKAFPPSPQAKVITAQMFASATSIGANIAEGKGKNSGREYLRYLTHAQGSANETDHWLHTTVDCGLATSEQAAPLLALLLEVLKILSAARTTLARQINEARAPRLAEQPAPYAAGTNGGDNPLAYAEPAETSDFGEVAWNFTPDWTDPLELDNP